MMPWLMVFILGSDKPVVFDIANGIHHTISIWRFGSAQSCSRRQLNCMTLPAPEYLLSPLSQSKDGKNKVGAQLWRIGMPRMVWRDFRFAPLRDIGCLDESSGLLEETRKNYGYGVVPSKRSIAVLTIAIYGERRDRGSMLFEKLRCIY